MKKLLGIIVLVVVVNVALRFVDFPDVDVSLPSFDVPDWLANVNRVKNFVIGGVIALAALGAVLKSRDR